MRRLIPFAAGIAVSSVAFGAYFLGQHRPDSTQAITPSASPTPAPSPSPTPTPTSVPAEISHSFNGDQWSKGEQLSLAVSWIDREDSDCQVHTYTHRGTTRAAFYSNCASWPNHEILFFHVTLKNVSSHAVAANLRDFVLVSRDGRTFGPINVRAEADRPTRLLPEKAKLPPGRRLEGWLTFDGRDEMIPAAISYIDRGQTLTQVFEGQHSVV